MKTLLIIGCAALLSGCCATKYEYNGPAGAHVAVSNNRFLWTTDAYNVNFGTNGTASISVSKSGTDNATIAAIVQGAIQGVAAAAPKP